MSWKERRYPIDAGFYGFLRTQLSESLVCPYAIRAA